MQTFSVIYLLGMLLQMVIAECPARSPCKASAGLFPVPGDCSSFFNCAHCRAFQQQCAPGTLFDPTLRVCNHAHQVQCTSSSGRNPGYSPGQYHWQSQYSSRFGKLDARSDTVVRGPSSRQRPAPQQEQQQQRPYHILPTDQSKFVSHHRAIPPPGPAISPSTNYSDSDTFLKGQTDAQFASGVKQREYPHFRDTQTGRVPEIQPVQTSHVTSTDVPHHAQEPQHHTDDQQEQPGSQVPARRNNRFEPIPARSYSQKFAAEEGQVSTQSNRYLMVPPTDVKSIPDGSEKYVQNLSKHGVSVNYRQAVVDHGSLTDSGQVSQAQGMVKELKYLRGQAASAVPGRRRYDHSHMAHHPEAVAYASTHEIVFDHSHGRHHQYQEGDHNAESQQLQSNATKQAQLKDEDGKTKPQDYYRNNRDFGVPRVTHVRDQEPDHYDKPFAQDSGVQSTPPLSAIRESANPSTTFDLNSRLQSGSGYVPRYVGGQIGDEEVGQTTKSYGERTFVRTRDSDSKKFSNTDQESQPGPIFDTNGGTVEPDMFYTDEALDDGPANRPGALSKEDMERIAANYVKQQQYPSRSAVKPHEMSSANVEPQSFQQGQQPPQQDRQLHPQSQFRHQNRETNVEIAPDRNRPFAPHLKQGPHTLQPLPSTRQEVFVPLAQ